MGRDTLDLLGEQKAWKLDPETKEITECDFMEWAEQFEDMSIRIVKQTDLPGYWVSTVFIGLGDNIFETMVFKREYDEELEDYVVDYSDLWEERVQTHNEALESHERGIKFVEQLSKEQESKNETKTKTNGTEDKKETGVDDKDS